MKRIATALVLVPVVVYLVLWAPEWALIAALAIVGILAFAEYVRIVGQAVSPAVLAGVVYVFAPLLLAVALRAWNPHWLMFALLLSWAGDTVAMYVGKSIGRHKLAPVISPNKTWEGAYGSIAGAMLAGGIYAHYLIPSAPLTIALLFAAIGNIAGQLGDLFESMLKRRANIKDSGASLPGHGGWLDRIDSMLFTIPVIYVFVRLFFATVKW
jgi:phosphatidate cytidylyltransferase